MHHEREGGEPVTSRAADRLLASRERILARWEERVRKRATLHASVDEACVKACTGYALVQAGFREQFMAILAHDLRNPLSAARAAATLILRKPAAEELPRWAARIVENVDRCDRMLQDLLDAMHAQTGAKLELKLEESDLVEIAQHALDNLRTAHGERFVVVTTEPVRGWFGVDQMRRAIENLAINAVKYGTAGRPITVTVRQLHGRAYLLVHNEGPHIPPAQQETLFRAFQRLSGQGEQRGWGLGLAQVRAVTEAHGGSIAVDSLPELGTTFTIDVPLDGRLARKARTGGERRSPPV